MGTSDDRCQFCPTPCGNAWCPYIKPKPKRKQLTEERFYEIVRAAQCDAMLPEKGRRYVIELYARYFD